MLKKLVSQYEIKASLFEMAPYKAAGIDGLHIGFYRSMWSIVGRSVCLFVDNFFAVGSFPPGTNDTLLTLIPKVQHPESLSQLRPIILCNVVYKVITKTMMNRLKQIMSSVIAPNQCSFCWNVVDSRLFKYSKIIG